jgi:hypothetical protein
MVEKKKWREREGEKNVVERERERDSEKEWFSG